MPDKGFVIARFFLRAAIGVVIVVEVVLALGILLQALGANPDAGFAEWAYRNQERLMGPFEDMFDDGEFGDGDGVIDVSGLFALGVYACLFIPLGMASGAIGRARVRNDARRQQAVDDARHARLLGGASDPALVERAPVGQRLRSAFRRRRPTEPDSPAEPDRRLIDGD